jgi:serine acetyltransferase
MATEVDETESSNKFDEIEKHEINIQYHLYLVFFILIYFGSFMIPGITYLLYFLLVFQPYVLNNSDFFALFIDPYSLIALLGFPLVMVISYLLHLFSIGVVTRLCWAFTEKMSATKDGVIPRNIPSDTLNYYHIRSFIIKYGKYAFTKGLFPWLSNWFFNFVGSSKIGKGTTIEEEIVADKYIDVGDNCYIGVNSAICSHVVEGFFGRIPYFEIKIRDNSTCSAFNIVGPGCELKENSYVLPLGSFGKHQVTKGGKYYFGLPARKIFDKKIKEYLKISEADLKKDENLLKTQKMKKFGKKA